MEGGSTLASGYVKSEHNQNYSLNWENKAIYIRLKTFITKFLWVFDWLIRKSQLWRNVIPKLGKWGQSATEKIKYEESQKYYV